MKKLFLFSLVFAFSAWGDIPEKIENKAFDPSKALLMDEAKPSEEFSAPAWKKAQAIPSPACTRQTKTWHLSSKSTIQATAFKETNVPVKGGFTRFKAVSTSGKATFKGQGVLDLSSWDSGVPARDYRVRKHVFLVEKEGMSTVPFHFSIETWNPKAVDWESPLVLEMTFLGNKTSLTLPARLHLDGKTLRVSTSEPKRFAFLSESKLDSFSKLMELCNHHFLASYADIHLDLQFESACK